MLARVENTAKAWPPVSVAHYSNYQLQSGTGITLFYARVRCGIRFYYPSLPLDYFLAG